MGERAGGGAGSGRQVEANSVEHAGLALVAAEDEAHLARDTCARSRGRRTGTCECLLFEPSRRLGAAARGTTRPSTWRSMRCPRTRRTHRVGAAYASARGDPATGGTGRTARDSERRSEWRAHHSFWRVQTSQLVCKCARAPRKSARRSRCTRECRPRIDANVHIPREHVEWQIRSSSLDGSDLVVLAADPPPRRSIRRLLDHACGSVQRVRRSGSSGSRGSRSPDCVGDESSCPALSLPENETPAATIRIVAHAATTKRQLQRHPRAAPRPAKLLPIPPAAARPCSRGHWKDLD